jgi:hypothetical protein
MPALGFCGIQLSVGDSVTHPTPDNDNWGVASSWQTPAEALQMVRRMQVRARKQLQADSSLWQCPEHRRLRDVLTAMERCALWHYYGVRER